jgi:hypothetical protein
MKPKLLTAKSLTEAEAELRKINVHPIGIQVMALKAVYRLVKFESVDAKTANIVKQEMLSRGGDVAVAESVGMFEDKKTGMILMGTLAQYIRLIRKLKKQSYGNCTEIAKDLQDLLFSDFDIDDASVW